MLSGGWASLFFVRRCRHHPGWRKTLPPGRPEPERIRVRGRVGFRIDQLEPQLLAMMLIYRDQADALALVFLLEVTRLLLRHPERERVSFCAGSGDVARQFKADEPAAMLRDQYQADILAVGFLLD